MKLHGYFRSSASYRVRIALGLKGLDYANAYHHLRKSEHRATAYLAINPQGLLPAIETDDGVVLTQSLAICEYLDEVMPTPPLLPRHPVERARVRALAQIIASDIHPLQNLRVLKRLEALGCSDEQVKQWAADFIKDGLDACEDLIADQTSDFCVGNFPTLADICLIPQLNNARRFGVQLCWPRLQQVEQSCLQLGAFQQAAPERQADAE